MEGLCNEGVLFTSWWPEAKKKEREEGRRVWNSSISLKAMASVNELPSSSPRVSKVLPPPNSTTDWQPIL
jgi:hypothetical protein